MSFHVALRELLHFMRRNYRVNYAAPGSSCLEPCLIWIADILWARSTTKLDSDLRIGYLTVARARGPLNGMPIEPLDDCVRSRPAMLPKEKKKRGRLRRATAAPAVAQSRPTAAPSGGPQQPQQQRQQQRPRVRCRQLALLVAVVSLLKEGAGFRLVDENGTAAPFVPYEQGFVGR